MGDIRHEKSIFTSQTELQSPENIIPVSLARPPPEIEF